ncbi:hypothetical protein PMAYCL1PPCAC_16623, partial [Pristionchus mayeri]
NIASIYISQGEKIVGLGHIRYNETNSDLLDASFHHAREFPSYTASPGVEDILKRVEGAESVYWQRMIYFPIEVRKANSSADINRIANWMRIKPTFHDALNSKDGVSVLFFLSDYSVLSVSGNIYRNAGITPKSLSTLHHQVWMHETNCNPFSWYLVVAECETISHGRARVEGRIFDESRKCVMSVVQEGYVQKSTERNAKI